MNIEIWLTFVVASIVLLIMPGPTILTVISYSISHSYKAKVPLILAVALGDATALFVSLLGLGALLAQSPFWFETIKWVGGIYLIILGIKLFRATSEPPALLSTVQDAKLWPLFLNTFMITALNPKGIIFFVAFLPQFINHNIEVAMQLWLLATTFVILATLNATLYATFASKAKHMLASDKTQKNFNICGATLLTIAGVWALFIV